jgi:uncharacterized protein YdaT
MKNARKKEIEIARAIGKNVYNNCLTQGFSVKEARLWAKVFKEAFLPNSDVYVKLRFARN